MGTERFMPITKGGRGKKKKYKHKSEQQGKRGKLVKQQNPPIVRAKDQAEKRGDKIDILKKRKGTIGRECSEAIRGNSLSEV